MKYGSLEWAQDLHSSLSDWLARYEAADDKGKAAADKLGITSYFSRLLDNLEKEIADGNYENETETDAEKLYYSAPAWFRANIGDSKKLGLLRLDGDFPADNVFKDSVTASQVVHPVTGELLSEHNIPLTKELLQKFKDAGIVKIDTAKTADLISDIDDDDNDAVYEDEDDKYADYDEDDYDDYNIDKIETTKINPNILGSVKDFGN